MPSAAIASTQIPKSILGLLTFGPPGSDFHGSRVTDISKFEECLEYWQSAGYRDVDTARTYVNGLQENWTKQAKWQQRGLKIATKWYPQQPGDHAQTMVKQQLEKSLSELGTDSVEIFYLHAPDRSVPFEETLMACNELYHEGKFKRLGLSNYAAWEVAELCTISRERGWVRPTVYQAMCNVLTRAIEDELERACRKFGLNIYVYNPLAGGVLTGRYSSKAAPTEGRFADTDPRIGKMYRDRFFKDANFEALRILEPVAKEHELNLLEIAFRWLTHHSKLDVFGGGDGIIIGVSSLEQLKGNVEALGKGPLPEAVVQVLDEIWEHVTKATCDSYWR